MNASALTSDIKCRRLDKYICFFFGESGEAYLRRCVCECECERACVCVRVLLWQLHSNGTLQTAPTHSQEPVY